MKNKEALEWLRDYYAAWGVDPKEYNKYIEKLEKIK